MMVVVGKYDKSYGVGVGVEVSKEFVKSFAFDYIEGMDRYGDAVEYYRGLMVDTLFESEDDAELEMVRELIGEIESLGYSVDPDSVKFINYPDIDENNKWVDSWVMVILLPIKTSEKFQYELEVDGYLVGSKDVDMVKDEEIKKIVEVVKKAGFTPYKVYEFMY